MADSVTRSSKSSPNIQGSGHDDFELPLRQDSTNFPSPAVRYTGWRYGRIFDLLSATGGVSIPGNPHDFKIVRVTWWTERRGLKHEYLVLETHVRKSGTLSRLFIRIERHKWLWRSTVPDDSIRVAAKEDDLTEGSSLFAMFTVHNSVVDDASYYTLATLGFLLEVVSQSAPTYRLPTLNCYWFAELCFECILSHYIENQTPFTSCGVTSAVGWRYASFSELWKGRLLGASPEELIFVCRDRTPPLLLPGILVASSIAFLAPFVVSMAVSAAGSEMAFCD
ncbi:hypothetical protein FRB94_003015 [Tulasnella sp. JGI-2019a]|nr:hypothetical protein FRB94_003015 [Tulasnella sp. JGI-2019a]